MRATALILGTFVLVLSTGCTSRYLTQEQDDEFRAHCEAQGCTVVPNPIMEQIKRLLMQRRGTEI